MFALTLLGVALFHHHTLRIALGGAAVIAVYKILVSPFKTGAGPAGFSAAGTLAQLGWPEILAALANGAALIVIAGGIVLDLPRLHISGGLGIVTR